MKALAGFAFSCSACLCLYRALEVPVACPCRVFNLQVKFIVDGHWLVDPRREVVHSSQGQQNNLLRVEKTTPDLNQQQLSQQQMGQQ